MFRGLCSGITFLLVASFSLPVIANSECDSNDNLTIVSATDDGLYEETHGPENTIDGDLQAESRWSSQSQGTPKSLLINLGAVQNAKSINIAWHKGDTRKSEFSVEGSVDNEIFKTVIPTQQSSGTTKALENYAFESVKAQYLRINANGNESNDWNSILEVSVTGCGTPVEKPSSPILTERQGQGVFNLRKDQPPGKNFDLKGWYMTTPADDNGDGKSDSVYETELAAGWEDPRYFYTDPATGGMVFRSTPAGAKTSKNTKYTRSELRGMLRRGDETIETRVEGGYPNKNNWVFSSAPLSAQAKAGGVDGVLKATLAVNQVTRLGKAYQVGRVIIGQIHAKDDEPIRLYYRKLPQNKYGSIFYAHEPATGKEQWIEVIGSRSDRAKNPDDGIALDERFSYEIEVKGKQEGSLTIPMLYVKIIRDDGSVVETAPLDMRDSGFSVEDDFMFFKAGAYSQNNSSPIPEQDFDRVIFYELEYSHSAPPKASDVIAALPDAATTTAEPTARPDVQPAKPGVVFDDNFADGGRDNGVDPQDANWWTSSNSSAIEVEQGMLGLVTGGSGRGIRTTFDPQAISEGQTLKATFSFTTPDTIGTDRDSALRFGFYDKLGRVDLEKDQSASSKKPNSLFDGLPGYMIDFDINLSNVSESNIDIRKHKNDTQGRLLGTTKGYQRLAGGGSNYQIESNQNYHATIAVKRVASGIEISGTLSQGDILLTEFSTTDDTDDTDDTDETMNFGMLAIHANSKTFGSSKKPNTPDNGIDFTRVKLEVLR